MGCSLLQSSSLGFIVCSGIDLSGRDVGVSQIIFNKDRINIGLYHMHGFRMAKNMRRDFGRHPRGSFPCHICIFLDDVCNSRTGQFVSASIPKQGHIYANYDIAEDRPCDTLELCLCKPNGTEENWSYQLNAAEREVLLRKMEE